MAPLFRPAAWVVRPSFVAAPKVRVKSCFASASEPDVKVKVLGPTVPFLPRPLKVAIPPTAGTVVVPVRFPVLIATVTSLVFEVTRLSEASRISMTGWASKFSRFTKFVAWVTSTSLVAAPGSRVTGCSS